MSTGMAWYCSCFEWLWKEGGTWTLWREGIKLTYVLSFQQEQWWEEREGRWENTRKPKQRWTRDTGEKSQTGTAGDKPWHSCMNTTLSHTDWSIRKCNTYKFKIQTEVVLHLQLLYKCCTCVSHLAKQLFLLSFPNINVSFIWKTKSCPWPLYWGKAFDIAVDAIYQQNSNEGFSLCNSTSIVMLAHTKMTQEDKVLRLHVFWVSLD